MRVIRPIGEWQRERTDLTVRRIYGPDFQVDYPAPLHDPLPLREMTLPDGTTYNAVLEPAP